MTVSARSIRIAGGTLRLEDRPLLMGVLNVTPDSFYDGGRYTDVDEAVAHAERMISWGADIIDVGGESTRPFSTPVPVEDEMRRIVPVVERVASLSPRVPVSIDTRRVRVAERALALGARVINDVGGMRDPEMRRVAVEHDACVVVMHMKGEPGTMQVSPFYEDVLGEVSAFLREQAEACMDAGIPRDSIILDPGIGFGKRHQDNLMLISNLDALKRLGYPLLVGLSRKSFIGEITGRGPEERLAGTLAANVFAYLHGADILRVHDVRESRDAMLVARAMLRTSRGIWSKDVLTRGTSMDPARQQR